MSARWGDLNAKQRRLAVARWHERKDAAKKPDSGDVEVAPGLTRGQLRRQTRTSAALAFGEPLRDNRAQVPRIDNWFSQYQQAVKDAQAQQTQNFNYAAQGVQNLQGGLDDAARKAWAGQQAAMSADAGNRGATVDPQLADVAHNASNVRNALTGSFGAMLVGQGTAENSYLGKRAVNVEVGRIDALKANTQERRKLLREKGLYKAKYRDDAKKAAVNNFLAEQLALNQQADRLADNRRANQSLATGDANSDASRRNDRYKWNHSLNKYGYMNGEWARMGEAERTAARSAFERDKGGGSMAGGKDQFGNTPLQRRERTSDYRKVLIDAKDTYVMATTGGTLPDGTQVPASIAPGAQPKAVQFQTLFKLIKDDYPSVHIDVIRAAAQKAIYGKIGPKLAKSLRGQGITF